MGLVAPDMVVTAGHCCDGQSASRLGVRVGNHHLYEDDPDQMDIAVSKVMLHEDYDSWTIENDICLLELESQADFSSSRSDLSLFLPQWRNTPLELTAPFLDGAPPLKAVVLERLS